MLGGVSDAAYDRREYQRATEEFVARPNAAAPIAEMMRIALEGVQASQRAWAAQWLKATCNVAIATDEQDDHNATPPAANSILR